MGMELQATFIDKVKAIGVWVLISFGLLESWAVLRHFFRATFWPASVVSYSNILGLIALLPIVLAFGFVWKNAWPLETADAKEFLRNIWLKVSSAVLVVYLAFLMGMAFTVIGFGQRGPFGAVMEGITGLSLPIDEKYWPVVFLGGIVLTIGQAHSMYAGLVRKS